MSTHDIETIHRMYRALGAQDTAGVVSTLDPRVLWVEYGGGGAPAGTFLGPDAVVGGVLTAIGASFDVYHAAPGEIVDQGNRILVRGRWCGRNKRGAALETGFEHVVVVRAGRIVRFENRPDDADAWAAGWTG
jgi:uncharacterized protein